MFNYKKYNAVITAIKDATDKTKGVIYEEIAEQLHVSHETVKSWGRPNSTGPDTNDTIEDLEQVLSIAPGTLGRREANPKKKRKDNDIVNDFSKNAIMDCYIIMKEYIHGDVEDEDVFANMVAELDKYKLAIPENIFDSIQQCIDEKLAPIVYENDKVFSRCYADDIGHFDDDGVFCFNDEEATKKHMMYFMMTLVDIEKSVDKWAMDNLHPLLVN